MSVALRKESVDRNILYPDSAPINWASLSARRAWIEIVMPFFAIFEPQVALRKESVDRNSLGPAYQSQAQTVALRKESVDRNIALCLAQSVPARRSPQGERG